MSNREVRSFCRFTITSDAGSIPAIVEGDPTVRRGVISMSHGFGGMPGSQRYDQEGSSTGELISTDSNLEAINAMPPMSAIPVNIKRRMPEWTS